MCIQRFINVTVHSEERLLISTIVATHSNTDNVLGHGCIQKTSYFCLNLETLAMFVHLRNSFSFSLKMNGANGLILNAVVLFSSLKKFIFIVTLLGWPFLILGMIRTKPSHQALPLGVLTL